MEQQEKAAKARDAALNTAIKQIQKDFGEGAIMKMGDEAFKVKVEAIPTAPRRSTSRWAWGAWPGAGPSKTRPGASDKNTLVDHVLGEAQKKGGICALIDARTPWTGVRTQDRRRRGRAARLPA